MASQRTNILTCLHLAPGGIYSESKAVRSNSPKACIAILYSADLPASTLTPLQIMLALEDTEFIGKDLEGCILKPICMGSGVMPGYEGMGPYPIPSGGRYSRLPSWEEHLGAWATQGEGGGPPVGPMGPSGSEAGPPRSISHSPDTSRYADSHHHIPLTCRQDT